MEYKQFGETYVVSIKRGEEIISSLYEVCEKAGITLGSISGIGAAENIELGYYDVETREYTPKVLQEAHEITALLGSITTMDGKIYIHAHITVGDKNCNAYAGHLAKAIVSGACEIFIHTAKGAVERCKDEEETGLNLWQFDSHAAR